jgi:3-mercaptopyruvate sulfurtransferase SseA
MFDKVGVKPENEIVALTGGIRAARTSPSGFCFDKVRNYDASWGEWVIAKTRLSKSRTG